MKPNPGFTVETVPLVGARTTYRCSTCDFTSVEPTDHTIRWHVAAAHAAVERRALPDGRDGTVGAYRFDDELAARACADARGLCLIEWAGSGWYVEDDESDQMFAAERWAIKLAVAQEKLAKAVEAVRALAK